MPEDLGERTEDATPKRLEDAREEGNVAKSSDAAAAFLLLGVTIMLWAAMMPMLGGMKVLVERFIGGTDRVSLITPEASGEMLWTALWFTARIGLPLLLVAWLLAYLSHFWQVGWLVSAKAVQPKLSKLNPISGFKRIFGLSGLVKAGLDSAKVGLVMLVAGVSIAFMMDTILLLPNLDVMQALGKVGWMLFDLALRILAALLLLGILDFIWQKWKHKRDLRMTRNEVRDELKQTDGDPETKKRRRRMQQQIAMQRLASDVPKADVIVTNPEHISIAIQYDESSMNAPTVVAKGQDFIALRIRQIATQHDIPIIERKPLARSLYRDVEVGEEVPPHFYQAIAEILAYVYRLSGRSAPVAT